MNFYINLPLVDRSCELCLHIDMGNFMALTLNNEIKHVSMKHSKHSIKFVCTNCNKQYLRKHAALCHLPKCTGQQPPTSSNNFVCIACGKGFSTKIGPSQRERHEHPLIRNEARITNAGPLGKGRTQPK